jgi:uncharacterized transporter YbjL
VIEGTKQVVVTLTFRVPPGVQPEQVAGMVGGGLTVAVGLAAYLKTLDSRVEDAPVQSQLRVT